MGEPRESAPRFPQWGREQMQRHLDEILQPFDSKALGNWERDGSTSTWTRLLVSGDEIRRIRRKGFAVSDEMIIEEAKRIVGTKLTTRGLNMAYSILPSGSRAVIVFETKGSENDPFISALTPLC